MTAALFRLLSIAAPSKALPALLAGVLAAASGIALIGTAAWIIASAALQPPLSALALAITMVRACGIGRAVFRYLDRLLSHRLAFACYEDLQQATYRRSAAVIPLREGNVREGEFLHDLLTGCETLRDFYLRTVPQPLIAGLLTAVTCTALLPLSLWGALLIAFLYFLHLALPHLLHEADLRTEGTAYREVLLDRLDGCTELAAAGTLTRAQGQLDRAAEDFQRRQDDKRTKRERLFTLLDILRVAVWILLIVLLTPCVADRMLTGVQYAVWVLVLEAVLSEYRPLPAASLGAAEAARAAETILSAQENSSAKKMPFPSPVFIADAPLIAAEHLTFSYHDDIPILRNFSCTIRRGEHTAIIGESGAGKTTLASLLLRLWEPDSGTISYRGAAHTALSADTSRALFGASLQGSYLFSTSTRDNFLRLHADMNEKRMWHALETAQLADVIRALPAGLDEPLGANAVRLSGGQRSRLLTALALAAEAEILLLDEPTAGLDAARGQRLIAAILEELDARDGTLIVITHDLPLLDRMKQVIEL
ncbi:amino acid ABC transporter ATP-binding/permease protein [Selenomonas sp. oral taxon 138]|uniref:amino acid ABC transporter ATP-binding/permease protein n=1 Tax=Selenomonas sp. oral taxon 138 TaxID=712532 RepID=UPI0002A1FA2A|nr:ATP-binding cassette domain-containing protein [Selenomonas sp. oral taxon 138]EKX94874.1 thiol reductant ABC exporter, CydC subunit [Selenomonas sp. oral taxon 138 str. F0429]